MVSKLVLHSHNVLESLGVCVKVFRQDSQYSDKDVYFKLGRVSSDISTRMYFDQKANNVFAMYFE